jgi:hypothetical protein
MTKSSPVLGAPEAAIVVAQLRDQFERHVRVNVVAIEKAAARFKVLKHNRAPFAPPARALRGTLSDHLPSLFAEIGADPALSSSIRLASSR